MNEEEKTFREYLNYRFDNIDNQLSELKTTYKEKSNHLEKGISRNQKKLTSLDKRTIILTIVMSIIYNNVLGVGGDILKRIVK